MINGFVGLTVAGWIHTILSTLGILVGAEQVLRTRRDLLHKRFGHVYVTCMVVGDRATLTIYRFNRYLREGWHRFALNLTHSSREALSLEALGRFSFAPRNLEKLLPVDSWWEIRSYLIGDISI